MQSTQRSGKKALWFRCGRFFLRSIKREDASDRWASWLSDPWTIHVLNTASRAFTKRDVTEYIKQFDQRSHLLLGIFEMGTRLHVGFIRVDINEAAGEALVNAVIGEPDYRNSGATTDVFIPLLKFLFDDVQIERVRASVLLRNEVTLAYLLKLGWQRDEAPAPSVKSSLDGSMLETCTVSWSRDGFRAFLQSRIGSRVLRRMAMSESVPARKPTRS